MVQAFLRLHTTPPAFRRWQSVAFLGIVLVILVLIPQVRVLFTAGLLGGIVFGAALIMARHQFRSPRPPRGRLIVLFPRQVNISAGGV